MFLPSVFSYRNQTMLKLPTTNETNLIPNPNPISNPNPPSFYFPFSTIAQNNGSLETHFVSQSLDNLDTLNATKEKPLRTRRKRKLDDGENPNPRKKTGKSDRHSKIYTAQGPRDRRMRLSVHIARKFFDLQDMLGFDKASKTIEWLFCQSRAAIREVALNNDPQVSIDRSFLSNCETVLENSFELGVNDCELGKVGQVSQAKESRDNARARARERTREKSIGNGTFEINPTTFQDLGFFGNLDQGIQFPIQDVGMTGNFVGTSSSASNPIFDFDKDFTLSGGVDSSTCFMDMFGNWEMRVPFTGNVVQEQNRNSGSYYQF